MVNIHLVQEVGHQKNMVVPCSFTNSNGKSSKNEDDISGVYQLPNRILIRFVYDYEHNYLFHQFYCILLLSLKQLHTYSQYFLLTH